MRDQTCAVLGDQTCAVLGDQTCAVGTCHWLVGTCQWVWRNLPDEMGRSWLVRPYMPHAPGARMTVVKQTSSNELRISIIVCTEHPSQLAGQPLACQGLACQPLACRSLACQPLANLSMILNNDSQVIGLPAFVFHDQSWEPTSNPGICR